MAGLPLPWLRHLKELKQKEQFEQSVRGSVTVLSRLYDLLEEKEELILTSETLEADYSDAAWAYKQAFRNGKRSALKEIKELLKFTQEK